MESNEYTTTFVYLQRNDHLETDKVFTITHSSILGIGGKVYMPFRVKVQHPAPSDITIQLGVSTGEGLEAGKIELSTSEVVIKAGQVQSEELIAHMPDLSFMKDNEDAAAYTFTVFIESIQTSGSDTKISSVYNALPATISKQPLSIDNLAKGTPANSHFDNRSEWTITLMDGVEGSAGDLIDGSSTDVAISNAGFWIMIDLGAKKTVSGIKTTHWGSGYCPTKIVLYISDDSKIWKSMGELETGRNATQEVKLKVPVETRYLKYDMLAYPGRVDVTEFNVYITN